MTTVKHTVSTDALETLGSIIDENAGRDAIHIAVEPVQAEFKLYPGQPVGKLPSGKYSADGSPKVGVVDPFLSGVVYPDQYFWLLIFPRQITSLRHIWTHPAFDSVESSPKLVPQTVTVPAPISNGNSRESKNWLLSYADGVGVEYDELMDHAHDYLNHGSYWNEGSRFEGEYVPDEFWKHFKNVNDGVEVPEDAGNFFSCSC